MADNLPPLTSAQIADRFSSLGLEARLGQSEIISALELFKNLTENLAELHQVHSQNTPHEKIISIPILATVQRTIPHIQALLDDARNVLNEINEELIALSDLPR